MSIKTTRAQSLADLPDTLAETDTAPPEWHEHSPHGHDWAREEDLDRARADLARTKADTTVWSLARRELETHAGRVLTDDEVAEFVKAFDRDSGELVGMVLDSVVDTFATPSVPA